MCNWQIGIFWIWLLKRVVRMVIRLTKGLMLSTRITLDTELFSYSIHTVIYVNYTVSGCNFHGISDFLGKAHGFDSKKFTYYRPFDFWYKISKIFVSHSSYLFKLIFFFFFFFFCKKKFWRTWVLFVGPLIPLFWTSGDISSGFQSQSGFCLIQA